MEKHKIRKEISELINSIKQHSDDIDDSKHIPQLELELILSKIKSLYEKSIVFNYLNSIPEIKTTPTTTIEEKIMVEISKKEEKLTTQPENKTEMDTPAELATEAKTEVERVQIKDNTQEENKKVPPAEIIPDSISLQKTYSDIKTFIGLNDKFQFANELFDGNMHEYDVAIQQLNSSENIDAAKIYFNSLQNLYNWDLENETVKRLLSIVEKRYS